jgi:hypothetical protein
VVHSPADVAPPWKLDTDACSAQSVPMSIQERDVNT